MKIISFHQETPFGEILRDLQGKIRSQKEKKPWRSFDDMSCMCVNQQVYRLIQKHCERYKATVEENLTIKLHAEEEIPWGVKYVGAQRRWKKGKGAGVKIGVIDTGISRDHFELKNRVKGGVDFVRGRQNGHGTHVAGIIVAEMNQRGIVGVSPESHIYDIRAFDEEGKSSLATILRAINWSIENGMDIVNMSFGMPQYSEALARVIKKANDRGVVMVASAGNNGGEVEYPARYDGVVGVSAIDQNGNLASFSSRGKGADRRAPGVDILSTWPGNQFRKLNGTSMAAPHVTGLMALQMARRIKVKATTV
ncbi:MULTISPECIES: S8 family peptidase [Brevibacillus]|uniref:Serine protease n=1 Tax=Brevibacillus invocatus TaxID=173959 RepID=A0A3M8CIN1_9BACL|nr:MULTISPECIES: S8 family peptidase [Brevibacillus]MCM3080294.1 S8 family peptidase [Brevibacillus invocatus]MCM3430453.1 S8 family peptidase [Brevibacillus invocatus]MDH4615807.1 S8 family peptidase [Brevibacillus sp. AY1]RNB75550.1 serine protease [Brevibacillus invocatus]